MERKVSTAAELCKGRKYPEESKGGRYAKFQCVDKKLLSCESKAKSAGARDEIEPGQEKSRRKSTTSR